MSRELYTTNPVIFGALGVGALGYLAGAYAKPAPAGCVMAGLPVFIAIITVGYVACVNYYRQWGISGLLVETTMAALALGLAAWWMRQRHPALAGLSASAGGAFILATAYFIARKAAEDGWIRRRRILEVPGGLFAFGPGGKLAATGRYDWSAKQHVIQIWDLGTRAESSRFAADGEPGVDVAWHGGTIAVAGRDAIRLYDAATGSCRHTLNALCGSIAFGPDGSWLAGGGKGGVTIWNVATGEPLRTLATGDHKVHSVLASGDALIATIDFSGDIVSWETKTWTPRPTVTGNPLGGPLALSAGGLLASGSESVKLWESTGGAPQRELSGGDSSLVSLDFLPGTSLLASLNYSGVARFHDAATGSLRLKRRVFSFGGSRVRFSADGRLLAFGDGSTLLVVENPLG